ncbi:uncharacterized protein LOC121802782 isoform X3 [Salvia splendens]|uniref:uncharacterized protein LOC121802782 isoform X3 n=1 Tax=Salvia splendens TaxID=180675 RepID=UPI001C268261|nr:uncharacterized protein LOC121802782 isoform X3 [Salvia splendens]
MRDSGDDEWNEQVSISNADVVLSVIRSDYEKAYFVTGRELYARNLGLLLPFFESPSIQLEELTKSICYMFHMQEFDGKTISLVASWKLRSCGMLKDGVFLRLKQFFRYSLLALKVQINESSYQY